MVVSRQQTKPLFFSAGSVSLKTKQWEWIVVSAFQHQKMEMWIMSFVFVVDLRLFVILYLYLPSLVVVGSNQLDQSVSFSVFSSISSLGHCEYHSLGSD